MVKISGQDTVTEVLEVFRFLTLDSLSPLIHYLDIELFSFTERIVKKIPRLLVEIYGNQRLFPRVVSK